MWCPASDSRFDNCALCGELSWEEVEYGHWDDAAEQWIDYDEPMIMQHTKTICTVCKESGDIHVRGECVSDSDANSWDCGEDIDPDSDSGEYLYPGCTKCMNSALEEDKSFCIACDASAGVSLNEDNGECYAPEPHMVC